MNLYRFFLSIIVALCFNLTVSSKQIHPLTQAMLDGYEQILKENPNDFFTLYQRAQQYYKLSMYVEAQKDITRAIELTPKSEKEMLGSQYSLLANIYIEQADYDKALSAINSAIENSANTYPLLNTKGNICLHLNDWENAKKAFRQMQQINSRSQEAFFGLARIAIAQGDISMANTLMTEAEKCDPSNYITYCRLGDLYAEMKDYERAATNYLSAFGLSSGKDRPMDSLIRLSRNNYDAVKNAIDYALSKANNTLPLYFLEANISFLNDRFYDAHDAYRILLDYPEGQDANVYARMAETCLAINKTDDALKYANRAVALNYNCQNLILKSKIERALGNIDNALIASNDAIQLSDRNNTNALVESALTNISLNKTDEAMLLLNEAIMVNGEEFYPLMIRAFVYDSILGDLRNSVADYQRASELSADQFPDLFYKAFALAMSGKKSDGDAIIESALSENPNNPKTHYYAAIYYAQLSVLDKAVECRNKAISLGFENEYLLKTDKTANLNLSPIFNL